MQYIYIYYNIKNYCHSDDIYGIKVNIRYLMRTILGVKLANLIILFCDLRCRNGRKLYGFIHFLAEYLVAIGSNRLVHTIFGKIEISILRIYGIVIYILLIYNLVL